MRTDKPKTVRAVHANRGIEVKYRRAIQKLIADMAGSIEYWLKAAYRKHAPLLAQDQSPSEFMAYKIEGIKSHWFRMFEELGSSIAETYVTRLYKASDSAFRAALKDAGWSVKFQMTPAMQDAFNAQITENIGLIRSIPEQYLNQVEGTVMRGYTAGRDLATMVQELKALYPKASHRAVLIARDQSNKANAVVNRARQMELGITDAVWMHSHGGREPRKSHVAANGKTYKVSDGCLIDGEYIFPGQLINCYTDDMPVPLTGSSLLRIWKSPFKGPMVHACIGSKLLKGTPNHPILTGRGWIALGSLNDSDKIVCMSPESRNMIDHNKNERVPTFGELFKACSSVFGNIRMGSRSFNFHGDIPCGYVDSVEIPENFLGHRIEPELFQYLTNFEFSKPDSIVGKIVKNSFSHPNDLLGFGDGSRSLFFGKSFSGSQLGLSTTLVPHSSVLGKHLSDSGAVIGYSEMGGDSGRSHSSLVETKDFFGVGLPVNMPRSLNAHDFESLTELAYRTANNGGSFFELGSVFYEFRSLSDKFVRNASCHVYTLQSSSGYYSISDASVITKNCRCTSRAVLPF